ncbi:hypothetical protein [Planctellipticum variicoloris]|uniref:hypothetical protein n=1 Tax=Planctellipticum variicoloris TaxID=3064265 RepID=UPI0030132212|nr:hypothetical protein SH412_003539 [Planctomycetaceae bacterium SH412]
MCPKRRIIDDALYAHFVTFSVYRRRRPLEHDRAGRIVLDVLNLVVERTGSGVWPGGTSGGGQSELPLSGGREGATRQTYGQDNDIYSDWY